MDAVSKRTMNYCSISLLFHVLPPFFFLWFFPSFLCGSSFTNCGSGSINGSALWKQLVLRARDEEEPLLQQRGYSGQRGHRQLCSARLFSNVFFFLDFAAARADSRPQLPLESCCHGGRTFASSW